MSRRMSNLWRAVAGNRRRYERPVPAICDWPQGCDQPPAYYNYTITGAWYTCPRHTPLEFRDQPIRPDEARRPLAETPGASAEATPPSTAEGEE